MSFYSVNWFLGVSWRLFFQYSASVFIPTRGHAMMFIAVMNPDQVGDDPRRIVWCMPRFGNAVHDAAFAQGSPSRWSACALESMTSVDRNIWRWMDLLQWSHLSVTTSHLSTGHLDKLMFWKVSKENICTYSHFPLLQRRLLRTWQKLKFVILN